MALVVRSVCYYADGPGCAIRNLFDKRYVALLLHGLRSGSCILFIFVSLPNPTP